MNNSTKISLHNLFEKYSGGLLVPEIQRDYVMGAGGDKLKRLLDAMNRHAADKKKFNFSSIITFQHKTSESERLEIYDGQQRLTTLFAMYLFALHNENKTSEIEKFKDWFYFSQRKAATQILNDLCQKDFSQESIKVCDFSSFSLKELLKEFSTGNYGYLTSEYLWKSVEFDKLDIDTQSEVEQFFMDLNSGVKLKDYELYKAKLVHRVNELYSTASSAGSKTVLEEFPYKLDNQWLNRFKKYASFKNPAEEYEICFIQYVLDMLCRQSDISCNLKEPSTLSENIIVACTHIMDDFESKFTPPTENVHYVQAVEFAWGTVLECTKIIRCSDNSKFSYEMWRGAYWNLKFEDYDSQLDFIITEVLLDKEKNPQMRDDLVIWAYLCTLHFNSNFQKNYLRQFKALLNYNVMENTYAWYECQREGQYLYYSKYGVCHIPQYYGKHMSLDYPLSEERLTAQKKADADAVHKSLLSLNYKFSTSTEHNTTLTEYDLELSVLDIIYNLLFQVGFNDVLRECFYQRKSYIAGRKNFGDVKYDDFCNAQKENGGIYVNPNNISGIENCQYFLGKVDFCWPIHHNTDCLNGVKVLLKCRMDKLYAVLFNPAYIPKNQSMYITENIVVRRYIEVTDEINAQFFAKIFDVEKVFFDKSYNAYKLVDRKTNNTKTYEKKGSNSDWTYKFFFTESKDLPIEQGDPESFD